ncbi:MAG: DUF4856 domain-containing protein [Rhodobacterales bacterium]|nr:DUF4856 domain-containing protein [Rhodobacterales bacterium]
MPASYDFASRFDGESSVSYSGQAFRHLLVNDVTSYIGGITGRIDGGSYFPVSGEVTVELGFYLAFDSSTSGSLNTLTVTDPPALQATYDDLSSDKDLLGKLAGNDPVGQHVDWSTGFVGWDQDGVTTPQSLVDVWVAKIDEQAVGWVSGDLPLDPRGAPVPAVYVTAEGQDLQQLMDKFLRGAVAFSQGADDYLDNDEPGKGLLADHSVAEEGKNYTALEHGWDEGFGYFGAARDYPAWTDDDIADLGYRDVNQDGAIDLSSEMNWGHSVNAAKRDRGSAQSAPNDFTAQAWEGFVNGRALLANTSGPLTDDEMAELVVHRDQARLAWENAIAATLVHYINDVLQDMEAMDTDEYSFADHSKHWSELKGFALVPQFNPASPLNDADFATLHDLLDTQPVLEAGTESERAEYMDDLLQARALIGGAYSFHSDNLGDDRGLNGW